MLDNFSSHRGLKCQHAVGRFCFQPVLGDYAFPGGVDGAANVQRVLGEVDGLITSTDHHLASPEPTVSGKEEHTSPAL